MVKEKLYNSGAIYSSMSGSGSTLFGVFKEAPNQSFEDLGQVWKFKL